MGRGTVRAGVPEDGQAASRVIQSGTDNTPGAPRVIVFGGPCRPVIVTNHNANAALAVKINSGIVNDFDGDSDDDGAGYFLIPIQESMDVSMEGQLVVTKVSFNTQHANDDLDAISVVGWRQ